MYQSSQLISGAPLVADDAPGDTEPDATRKWTTGPQQPAILVQLVDGVSATATAWTYDGASWAEANGGSGNEANLVAGVPAKILVDSGATTFVQLTSVVGTPTRVIVAPPQDTPLLLALLASTTAVDSLKRIRRSAPITAHDTNTIEETRAILVGSSGNLVAKLAEDAATRTFPLSPGMYPLGVVLVHSDTTIDDADLFALY